MGEERIILLRNKVQELEEYFRIKNKEGIDLYLNNPNNQRVKNYYTDDGKVKSMTRKEAMEYYAQENFKDFEYEYQEQNKSKGCGGTK